MDGRDCNSKPDALPLLEISQQALAAKSNCCKPILTQMGGRDRVRDNNSPWRREMRTKIGCAVLLLGTMGIVTGAAASEGTSGVAGNRGLSPIVHDATPPKDFSKPYIERQTFKGKAFYKDNNDWVYTAAFAKTFGMPPENIYPELTGIEAAAFRIEEASYQQCGLGGKAENCTDQFRCVTDVYIDEAKYPLPWATSDQSDWLADYNSLHWLQVSNDLGTQPRSPLGVISDTAERTWFSLHPFAEPESHREILLFENSNTPYAEDYHSNRVRILGYKRKAIAGLTMLSLDYNCLRRNSEKHTVTFHFNTYEWVNGRRKMTKRFHEFQLPDVFHRKIDERFEERSVLRFKDFKRSINLK
jgi:hypothetical protein